MKKQPVTLAILALLSALYGSAAHGASPALNKNFLLGSWHLKAGASGCNTRIVFAPKHQDFTWRGQTSGAPVSGYVISGDSIIVGGAPGVIETFSYKVFDGNTIGQPQMSGGCVWSRG
jgi:hypothetical protein